MMDLCAVGDLSWLVILSVPVLPHARAFVPILETWRLLGNDAAIVALQGARLGMKCALLSTNAISLRDGQMLLAKLQREGVDISLIGTQGSFTPTTYFVSKVNSDERTGLVEVYDFQCLKEPGWLPASSFAYIDLYDEHLEERLRFVRSWSRKVRCLVNLSATHLEEKIAALADIPLLDTIQVRGAWERDEAIAWGQRVRQSCSARAVLITSGEAGASLIEARDSLFVAAEPVQAVRTIGAGASFSAGFLRALTQGATYQDAARFASKQAAAFCAAPRNPCEVE